jgi:hypothetical protein
MFYSAAKGNNRRQLLLKGNIVMKMREEQSIPSTEPS